MASEVLLVVGTRPNFVKLAPLYHNLKNNPKYNISICHTGQHFDHSMSNIFWDYLKLPDPNFQLHIKGLNTADTIGKTICGVNEILAKCKVDIVIVFGDVNATVAAAISASHNQIKVVHVEAGLRSFDRSMPEEINRMLTDQLSDLLFVSEESGVNNLNREGISKEKIFFVGNILIENLIRTKEQWQAIELSDQISKFIENSPFFVATFHRPENVDSKESLTLLKGLLNKLAEHSKVIFSVHPRTKINLTKFGLLEPNSVSSNILICEPLAYFEFIKLISISHAVITDSGGVQEETSFIGKPCITFRKNTERPVTVSLGTNMLLNMNENDLIKKIKDHIAFVNNKSVKTTIPLWDENVSLRIIEQLDKL